MESWALPPGLHPLECGGRVPGAPRAWDGDTAFAPRQRPLAPLPAESGVAGLRPLPPHSISRHAFGPCKSARRSEGGGSRASTIGARSPSLVLVLVLASRRTRTRTRTARFARFGRGRAPGAAAQRPLTGPRRPLSPSSKTSRSPRRDTRLNRRTPQDFECRSGALYPTLNRITYPNP